LESVAEEFMQLTCGDDMEARNEVMRRVMMKNDQGIEQPPLE
jgi:hypothetical protein